MESTNQGVQSPKSWNQVTPLSKYLAMVLFILMPFIGGWIGYTYAPEKVVETTLSISEDKNTQSSDSTASSTILVNDDAVPNGPSINETYFGLPLFPRHVFDIPNSVDDLKVSDNRDGEKASSVMEGEYSWGSGPPRIYVKETILSVTNDPDCDYGCVPISIAQLDYYTYKSNSDLVLFYTEELDVSRIRNVEYVILGYDNEKFTLIQSISKRYCCDDGGEIVNRVLDVDIKENKTILRTDTGV